MPALVDFDLPTLEAELGLRGFATSHARRILLDFYKSHGETGFTSEQFGKRLLAWLAEEIKPRPSSVIATVPSGDGTEKLLIRFAGGGAVESVLMPGHRADRAAGCISSQIGCAMQCDFCASTRHGLERDLDAGEIVEQFLHLRARAVRLGRRLTSLVFMGMGEPLLNLANVIPAIRRIAAPHMGALGWRQITVSTVGIVPGIDALAAADLNVHLALSLHAADDETRSRIVPANRRYPVREVMSAARRFADRSGRIPTIEYCLLAEVNDSATDASRLAQLMRGFRAHVNLIPYNAIGPGLSGFVYARPTPQRVAAFLAQLRGAGVVCHIRQTRGDDVNAACGQLRIQQPVGLS